MRPTSPAGLEHGERRVLVLGDRCRVGRVPAEPRDGLGAVQRAGDRRAPVAGVGEHALRDGERLRPQPRDARDVLFERDDDQIGVLRRVRRQAQRQVALERAGLQEQVGGASRGGRLRDLDERADRRGGEQPRPLARRVGVGAQRGCDGHDGDERVVDRRDDDGHRLLAPRARQRELALGAGEVVAQQRAQLGDSLAWRRRPPASSSAVANRCMTFSVEAAGARGTGPAGPRYLQTRFSDLRAAASAVLALAT